MIAFLRSTSCTLVLAIISLAALVSCQKSKTAATPPSNRPKIDACSLITKEEAQSLQGSPIKDLKGSEKRRGRRRKEKEFARARRRRGKRKRAAAKKSGWYRRFRLLDRKSRGRGPLRFEKRCFYPDQRRWPGRRRGDDQPMQSARRKSAFPPLIGSARLLPRLSC